MTKVFETYGDPQDQIQRVMKEEPHVFNGIVRVERYRVTIERIEEPQEALQARLIELLDQPGHIDKNKRVRQEAKRLGVTLDS